MELLTIDRANAKDAPPPARRHALVFQGEIAILDLSCPAPSAWTPLEQARFLGALSRLAGRQDLTAIVLHGDRLFDERACRSGGVRHPFSAVVEAIAACPIPVIAAIAGDARGAGLELALACAARAATARGRFALPDLQSGRLPVHGAVERLPRLIGLRQAAEIIIFGARWDAAAALAAGLLDAVAPQEPIAQAKALAASFKSGSLAPRSKTMSWETAASELCDIRQRVHRLGEEQVAPLAALRALETAAQLPLRRAALETAKIAEGLSRTDQARALGYLENGVADLARRGGPDAHKALAGRLRWPLLREALHLLDEGAAPGQVDRCLVAYGFAEGPFAEADRRGLAAVFGDGVDGPAARQPWRLYSPTLDLMADAGRPGDGAPGWYRRSEGDGGYPVFDAEVGRLIEASAVFQRLARRPIPDETIVDRCLMAAISASAGELQDDAGLGGAAIDALWTHRLGFPAWKGGPLHQAAQIGLPRIVERLAANRARRDTLGAPSQILVRAAASGGALR